MLGNHGSWCLRVKHHGSGWFIAGVVEALAMILVFDDRSQWFNDRESRLITVNDGSQLAHHWVMNGWWSMLVIMMVNDSYWWLIMAGFKMVCELKLCLLPNYFWTASGQACEETNDKLLATEQPSYTCHSTETQQLLFRSMALALWGCPFLCLRGQKKNLLQAAGTKPAAAGADLLVTNDGWVPTFDSPVRSGAARWQLKMCWKNSGDAIKNSYLPLIPITFCGSGCLFHLYPLRLQPLMNYINLKSGHLTG